MDNYVLLQTTKETSGGRVVINKREIASLFQRDGDTYTSVVLTNGIGYQVVGKLEEVARQIDTYVHCSATQAIT